MKCPLRSYSYKGVYDQDQREDLDCLKQECAWWEKPLDVCCIRAQEATLGVILEQLVKLIGKMPKDLAPGR